MGNTVVKDTCRVVGDVFYHEVREDGSLVYKNQAKITELQSVEQSDPTFFDDFTNGSKTVDFCLTDFESYQKCAGLFTLDRLEQYKVRKSKTKCTTPWFRSGAVLKGPVRSDLTTEGTLCEIVFSDYDITSERLKTCCYDEKYDKCNKHLKNGYTTSHCDLTMKKYCKRDLAHPSCLKWLESAAKRDDNHEALQMYSNWCKKNHEQQICTYLCKVARQHKTTARYCDEALLEWCKLHPHSPNCHCILVPKRIENIKTFIGPKECWLTECVNTSSKWLTTDQLKTKRNCNITACLISIDKLVLGDQANVKLINDCVTGLASDTSGFELKSQQNTGPVATPGILFSPEILLLSLCGTALYLMETKKNF